ncbi:NAD(P)/FAD-dependent oxidoreductase [Mycetocola manganoxydans]|uniref:NAD(P)/FAD-dependent oxidoreductase n=1 Tax=Mycetocola manganoxydans TaxID=699879 RepID=A0A3L6ZJL8_9MICO|nr:FAD/NAD(P)-binding oxidoreductase [Mycetocola manganoxydans]RLP68037.1 NAD(P)/FAD-dependent oxidoreductase [Mycetocola manganoxydans]GHD52689.1 pyridine nucleotide-disulfide oxidoreductase [Mycetocola manganoxydans]
MTTEPSRVVIVGASAAGLTTATALRRNGYDRDITLVDAETRAPYDRPPLSKHLLSGEWSEERLALKTDAELADLAVGIRSGVRATELDVAAQRLALSDGSEIGFDRLVLATGVRPRMLPGSDALRGVHTLRTLEDALSLRADLRPGMRLVVVGGGFLGTEVAATAVGLGADVTLVSAAPTPLERSLGPAIGVQVASLHRARGVVLRTGPSAAVVSLVSSGGSVTGVELADGTRLDADAVFVAIGAEPDLRWLAGSGIPIGDGIECAPDLSVAPGVYAAGDVARWENPVFGEAMRVEHRTNATEQGMHVAKRIVAGDAVPFASVPYFWTDQYDLKLQVHGWLRGYDEVRVVEGSFDEGRMVALFRRGERLVGVMGIGAAKVVRGWRQHVLDGAAWASVVDA